MRIDRIYIKNYRGIQLVDAADLGSQPVILISGRNGTGKTLILEAIILAWSGHNMDSEKILGPWGNETIIELGCRFTEDERATIRDWTIQSGGQPRDVPELATIRRTWQTLSGGAISEEFPIDTLRSSAFQKDYKFGVIDFLASDRSAFISDASSLIDLTSLVKNQRDEQQRKNTVEQFLSRGTVSYVGDAVGYLAAADYMDLIALRDGEGSSNEFDMLTNTFFEATGKRINRPEIDPARGMRMQVSTLPGVRHGVGELSAGERETLCLLFFARTLNAQGGILVMDEPEQHLHPILQVALFDLMSELAEKSQVIAVSHSANLISSMPSGRLLEMLAPGDEAESQLVRVESESDRSGLFADLGLRPATMLQNEALLIVEGNRDESVLRRLYPLVLSRFRVVVVSGVRGVMQACQTLETVEHDIPWICLRDRDLLSDDDVERLQRDHPSLYIWPNRMLENELLNALLVSDSLGRVGQVMPPADVEMKKRSIADGLREEVLSQSLVAEIERLHPIVQVSTSNVDKLRERYVSNSQIHATRSARFDEIYEAVSEAISTAWDSDWARLVNGKQLMARMVQESPFRAVDNFISALAASFVADESLAPSLRDFKERLVKVLR